MESQHNLVILAGERRLPPNETLTAIQATGGVGLAAESKSDGIQSRCQRSRVRG